jgi:hypothetical protein
MKSLLPLLIIVNSHFVDAKIIMINHKTPKPNNLIIKNESTFECDFHSFVSHPEVPELAKKIYLNQDWSLSDDIEVLALLDSLYASNADARSFYFKVVTLTESKADGYFSEGLSFAAYKYVLNKTPEFSGHFDKQYCHTEADINTWARFIKGEFLIQFEDKRKMMTELENYCIQLQQNCVKCSENQKLTLQKLIKNLLYN